MNFVRVTKCAYPAGSINVLRRFSINNSVDAEELRKFASIGRKWWDPTSTTGVGPLHRMNPVRVSYIREMVAKQLHRTEYPTNSQLKDLDIVDVGCGGGLLSESLARLGGNVTGLDPALENICIATEHAQHDPTTKRNKYIQTTIGEHSKEHNGKYDVVCSLEVLEHVPDVKQFLQECTECLKPGGSMFLSTMNKTRKAYLMTILAAEYITETIPIGTHDWEKYISPDDLTKMLHSQENMQVMNVKGMVPDLSPGKLTVNPRNLQWKLSNSDLDVNYILHAVKK